MPGFETLGHVVILQCNVSARISPTAQLHRFMFLSSNNQCPRTRNAIYVYYAQIFLNNGKLKAHSMISAEPFVAFRPKLRIVYGYQVPRWIIVFLNFLHWHLGNLGNSFVYPTDLSDTKLLLLQFI